MLNQQMYSDNQLVRYLLGMTPGEERERFDEMSFVDDEFAERLQAVEDDLMDSYNRGELSGEELARFRSLYLNSPQGRSDEAFSLSFLKLIDAKARQEEGFPAAAPAKPSRWHQKLASLFSVPESLLQGVLAATTVSLLIAGSWLVVQNIRLRKEADQAEAARREARERETETQARLRQEQSSRSKIASTLEESREKISQLEHQLAERHAAPSAEPTVVNFDLEPGEMGLPEHAGVISFGLGVSHIALHLELWPNPFQRFSAELQSPANNTVVWRSGRLNARRRGDSRIVDVLLPANLLTLPRYNLKLFGLSTDLRQDVSPNQQIEPISSYSFRIVRP